MDKRLKECSTSTDVEPVHDVNKVTSPLQKAKRELENSENLKVTRKKQKKHNEKSEKKLEIKELRESYEEITKITKAIHEIILTRPDVPAISFKKETPTKKVERIYECDFSTNDAQGFGKQTKFDTSAPWPETKGTLRKHCGSCGTVTRVYAPIECAIGAARFSLGLAEIKHEHYMKGVTLSGSDLGGWKLHVMMPRANFREYYIGCGYNCERCSDRPGRTRNYYRNYSQKRRTFGSPFSKFGRFAANIGRFYS